MRYAGILTTTRVSLGIAFGPATVALSGEPVLPASPFSPPLHPIVTHEPEKRLGFLFTDDVADGFTGMLPRLLGLTSLVRCLIFDIRLPQLGDFFAGDFLQLDHLVLGQLDRRFQIVS